MKQATSRNSLTLTLTRLALLVLVVLALVACGERNNEEGASAEPTVMRAEDTPEAVTTPDAEEVTTEATPVPPTPEAGELPEGYPGSETEAPGGPDEYPAP